MSTTASTALSAPATYSRLSISLHWVMLVLMAAVYACIELRELYPRGSDIREGLKAWHFMLGLLVFVLVLGRMVARWRGPRPSGRASPQEWLGRLMHIALYALMIVMPIMGWVILSAEGKPIPFFGLSLPPLTGPDDAFAHQIEDLHETIGELGYWMIGLHAAAALVHHYVLRDGVLLRMLPFRR